MNEVRWVRFSVHCRATCMHINMNPGYHSLKLKTIRRRLSSLCCIVTKFDVK